MKAACLALLLAAPAAAQSPFLTDDANVAPRGGIHLEITNRFDSLSPHDLPATSQYTGIVDFKWGALSRVEIGFDFPLLSIHGNDPGQPQTVTGLGDLDFSTKGVLVPGERRDAGGRRSRSRSRSSCRPGTPTTVSGRG